jgi:PEP-CTERM motif
MNLRTILFKARRAVLLIALSSALGILYAGPVVLPVTGSPTCQGSVGDTDLFNCASSVTDSPLTGTLVSGVEFSTTSAIVFPVPSVQANDAIILTDTGMITGGMLSGSLPVSYDFQVTSNGLVEGWGITIELGTAQNGALYGSQSFGGTFGSSSSSGSANGSGTLTLLDTPISGQVVESIFFQVAVSPGTTMSATFPFAIGAVNGNATAPEPASVGLIGSGLGLMAWVLRRKRKNQIKKADSR